MEFFVLPFGLLLASFQITVLEGFLCTVESCLRVVPTTSQPTCNQKTQTKDYGTVWPLLLAVAALAVPAATQPMFILTEVSSK